jgi:hypothetical protein
MNRAAMLVMLMFLNILVVLDATQGLAEAVVRDGQHGIQAGHVIDIYSADCPFSDSADLLFRDAEAQARSGWLRLDFRGAGSGCRGRYQEFLSLIDQDMNVIGMLGHEFHSADDPAAFAAAAQALACDPAFAGVDAWEIWNEPNHDETPLTAQAYAHLLVLTSAELRECGRVVVSAGIHPDNAVGYLEAVDTEIKANPLWPYTSLTAAVDGIGMHPYVNAVRMDDAVPPGEHKPLEDFVWQFDSAGSGNDFMVGEDLYITEIGFRLPGDGETVEGNIATESDQCFSLLRSYEFLAGRPRVKAAVWFTLKDFGQPDERFGLYDDAENPRLSRGGYVTGDCGGPTAGLYDPAAEQLAWSGGPGTYKVYFAPEGSETATRTKTVTEPKLFLFSFGEPLEAGRYAWWVVKEADGKQYRSREMWPLAFDGIPAVPTGVTVTAHPNGTQVTVGWTDKAVSEAGYEIENDIGTVSVAANRTSYSWTGLDQGIRYCFQIRSYNGYGASDWTLPACIRTPKPPARPSGVTAAAVSGTAIRVKWTDNSSTETGFHVSDYSTRVTVAANDIDYTWSGLDNGEHKCFRVRSFNVAGPSAWAGPACATTPTIPARPTSPTAVAISGTAIRVKWVDNASNEWGFEVANDDGVSDHVAEDAESYTWDDLARGTTMCFRVRAYNLAGDSAWTGYACATTPTVPLAPTIGSAAAVSGTAIKITWTDRSGNETDFQVTDGSATRTAGANATAFTWVGLANGTTRCFRVRSHNLAGSSAWSLQTCATTPVRPPAPTYPTATAVSESQVKVTWNDKSGNETGFQIENGDGYVASTGPNVTAYTWSSLPSGTRWCFRVRAINLAGPSDWTSTVCATTYGPPAMPTILSATATSTSSIKVTWADKSSNETSFQIYDGVLSWGVGPNTTVFYRSGLSPGQYMCFTVRAVNSYGESAWTPYMCTSTWPS